jgi:hypothetical protein
VLHAATPLNSAVPVQRPASGDAICLSHNHSRTAPAPPSRTRRHGSSTHSSTVPGSPRSLGIGVLATLSHVDIDRVRVETYLPASHTEASATPSLTARYDKNLGGSRGMRTWWLEQVFRSVSGRDNGGVCSLRATWMACLRFASV